MGFEGGRKKKNDLLMLPSMRADTIIINSCTLCINSTPINYCYASHRHATYSFKTASGLPSIPRYLYFQISKYVAMASGVRTTGPEYAETITRLDIDVMYTGRTKEEKNLL